MTTMSIDSIKLLEIEGICMGHVSLFNDSRYFHMKMNTIVIQCCGLYYKAGLSLQECDVAQFASVNKTG